MWASPSGIVLVQAEGHLLQQFNYEDTVPITSFCGITIEYNRVAASLVLQQHAYMRDIIREFLPTEGMSNSPKKVMPKA